MLHLNYKFPQTFRLPLKNLFMLGTCTVLSACLGIPDGATAVSDFDLERYLGTWYEAARLDHRFERGLTHVQAQYSLREDGGVRVVNRGFKREKGEWKEAEGKAFFIGPADVGRLKVSFFGPFYSAYNVLELDHDSYQYALVAGANTSYLWILTRRPDPDPDMVQGLVQHAASLGFPVDELIFVEQGDVHDLPAEGTGR
jgi:apolipoprotein D and lipocalin family protein